LCALSKRRSFDNQRVDGENRIRWRLNICRSTLRPKPREIKPFTTKEAFVSIIPERHNVVSNLSKVEEHPLAATQQGTFTSTNQQQQAKNSIRVVVQETQLVPRRN
jgi:hypothetical protein